MRNVNQLVFTLTTSTPAVARKLMKDQVKINQSTISINTLIVQKNTTPNKAKLIRAFGQFLTRLLNTTKDKSYRLHTRKVNYLPPSRLKWDHHYWWLSIIILMVILQRILSGEDYIFWKRMTMINEDFVAEVKLGFLLKLEIQWSPNLIWLNFTIY